MNIENWGLRKLAYQSKKINWFYNLIEFNAESPIVDKLEIQFRRDERVIRFLTLKMEKYAVEYAEKRRKLKSTKEVKEN